MLRSLSVKNVLHFLTAMFVIFSSMFPESIRLKDLNNPDFDIHVHGERLYIPEEVSTYIYSLKDYSLKGKFGKKGEGPGELRGEIYIDFQKDKLLVESAGKISYFNLEGTFISELIFPEKTFVKRISTVGDKFAGFGGTQVDGGVNYIVLSFYNNEMKKMGEITRTKSNFQKDGTIEFMNGTFNFKVYQEMIYVQYLGEEMNLDVFDKDGKLLFKIGDPYFKNKKVSEKDKKEAMDYFRKFWPRLYTNRQRVKFSDKWGGVGTFFFDESKNFLYIITYNCDSQGRYLFYKYKPEGKFIKKFYLDVGYRDIWAPFPLDIENGKLYQLVENDDEGWDLVIRDLK